MSRQLAYPSLMCMSDNNISPTSYQCKYKSTYTTPGGMTYKYCVVAPDTSLTWTQAQGACIALGYTSTLVMDSSDKLNFFLTDDNNYLYVTCSNIA